VDPMNTDRIAGAALIAISAGAVIAFLWLASMGPIYIGRDPPRTTPTWTDTQNPASDYAANTAQARRGVIDPRTGEPAVAGEMLGAD
jgi:hypothetical protein